MSISNITTILQTAYAQFVETLDFEDTCDGVKSLMKLKMKQLANNDVTDAFIHFFLPHFKECFFYLQCKDIEKTQAVEKLKAELALKNFQLEQTHVDELEKWVTNSNLKPFCVIGFLDVLLRVYEFEKGALADEAQIKRFFSEYDEIKTMCNDDNYKILWQLIFSNDNLRLATARVLENLDANFWHFSDDGKSIIDPLQTQPNIKLDLSLQLAINIVLIQVEQGLDLHSVAYLLTKVDAFRKNMTSRSTISSKLLEVFAIMVFVIFIDFITSLF